MTWTHATYALIIGATVVIILYDVAARIFGGNDATVSAVIYDASQMWPVIAFAFGFVCGHWFWPVR